jgi:hypothetical protein
MQITLTEDEAKLLVDLVQHATFTGDLATLPTMLARATTILEKLTADKTLPALRKEDER